MKLLYSLKNCLQWLFEKIADCFTQDDTYASTWDEYKSGMHRDEDLFI